MHLKSMEGGEELGVCIGEFGGVEGITAIFGRDWFIKVTFPALSQLWGLYTAAEMPRSFNILTSPKDVLIVVVDSLRLVKDSARLKRRGVQGVLAGVCFRLLKMTEAGVGVALRLGVTRVSSSDGCKIRQVVNVNVELV